MGSSFEDGRVNNGVIPTPDQSAARESLSKVTTAKEKMINHAKATSTAVLSKIAHPFSGSQARQEADAKAAETKAQASAAKQESIRTKRVQQQVQQQQQMTATTPATNPSDGGSIEREPNTTATAANAGSIPKPLGGTQDSAYTDISQPREAPASTFPHADVRPTSSGRLQTHYY